MVGGYGVDVRGGDAVEDAWLEDVGGESAALAGAQALSRSASAIGPKWWARTVELALLAPSGGGPTMSFSWGN